MSTKEKNRYQRDLQLLDNEIAKGIFVLDDAGSQSTKEDTERELNHLYYLQGLVLEQLDMG